MEEKKVVCSKCDLELKGPSMAGAFMSYPEVKFCEACVRFTVVPPENPSGKT